jgi:serine/threonine protein kinase
MVNMSDFPNARPGSAPLPDEGSDALPAGTRLAEFEIRQVLGAGGFGIVYRAWDEALHRDVALKEYMPVSLAGRGAGERVTLRSRTHEENFAFGLQSFVNEARLLARFDQPALVKVFRFWEGNGTAYMAMPLYNGRTLRQLRKEMAPGTLDDAWTRALIEPLLGALEVMHDAAVYHRDIAPDNILWCDDSRPVLLDFGAARLVLADRTQNVTAILKPQFAPIEQYAETQAMRQGPWTDLYALASTCYFMLTGRAPLPATARVLGDELVPLARLAPPGCSPRLLQILDWAMAVRPQDRPQSVAQFRAALAGRIAVPVRAGAQASAASADTAPDPSSYEKTMQATMRHEPTRRTPVANTPGVAASAPGARPRHDDDLERPERSVMLPPKSGLPLKPLLLLLIVATVAAGAWTTRRQWMPAVGLQAAALPAAERASSAEALASAAASMPIAAPASAAVAEAASAAASATAALASVVAASAAAAPASEAASSAPVAVAADTPASHPVRPKSTTDARSKALAARIAALTLPPPVLPPTNESHVVTSAHTVGNATPEAGEPTAAAPAAAAPASAAPAAPRELGPREVCADQGPTKMAACVKRLCDTYPRYALYPVCQRVHRQEDQQQQRGGSE